MDYQLLSEQVLSVTNNVKNNITNFANASALLFNTLPDINWAGFYIANGDVLELGPFQGKVACTLIPKGKGVCGTAFALGKTIVVPNVHEFKGHIACDSDSNSEIVIPVIVNGTIIAVLDIDSTIFDKFSDDDRIGLELFVANLAKNLE